MCHYHGRYLPDGRRLLKRLVLFMIRESADGHEKDGTTLRPTIVVVDPDRAVAELVRNLARFRDLAVSHFVAAKEYLERAQADQPGCVVAEVEIPGISGIQLLGRLRSIEVRLPVIIISANS